MTEDFPPEIQLAIEASAWMRVEIDRLIRERDEANARLDEALKLLKAWQDHADHRARSVTWRLDHVRSDVAAARERLQDMVQEIRKANPLI